MNNFPKSNSLLKSLKRIILWTTHDFAKHPRSGKVTRFDWISSISCFIDRPWLHRSLMPHPSGIRPCGLRRLTSPFCRNSLRVFRGAYELHAKSHRRRPVTCQAAFVSSAWFIMFTAAFMSLSRCVPQCGHIHSRTFKFSSPLVMVDFTPQNEHVCVDG